MARLRFLAETQFLSCRAANCSSIKAHSVWIMMASTLVAYLTPTLNFWDAPGRLKWRKARNFRRHFRVCQLIHAATMRPFMPDTQNRYIAAAVRAYTLPALTLQRGYRPSTLRPSSRRGAVTEIVSLSAPPWRQRTSLHVSTQYPRKLNSSCNLFSIEPRFKNCMGKKLLIERTTKGVKGGWAAAPQVHLLFISLKTKQLKLTNKPRPVALNRFISPKLDWNYSDFSSICLCVWGYFNHLLHAYQRKSLKLILVSTAAQTPQWTATHRPTQIIMWDVRVTLRYRR